MKLWKSRVSFPIPNRCNSSMEYWTAWGGIWKRRGRKAGRPKKQRSDLSSQFSNRIELELEKIANRKSDFPYGITATKSGLQVNVTPPPQKFCGKEICCISFPATVSIT